MKLRPFKILPTHRQGIQRAAEWHDHMSKIFRDVIVEHQKYKIGYAEHLWRAEEHENAARELRQLLKANAMRPRNSSRNLISS